MPAQVPAVCGLRRHAAVVRPRRGGWKHQVKWRCLGRPGRPLHLRRGGHARDRGHAPGHGRSGAPRSSASCPGDRAPLRRGLGRRGCRGWRAMRGRAQPRPARPHHAAPAASPAMGSHDATSGVRRGPSGQLHLRQPRSQNADPWRRRWMRRQGRWMCSARRRGRLCAGLRPDPPRCCQMAAPARWNDPPRMQLPHHRGWRRSPSRHRFRERRPHTHQWNRQGRTARLRWRERDHFLSRHRYLLIRRSRRPPRNVIQMRTTR